MVPESGVTLVYVLHLLPRLSVHWNAEGTDMFVVTERPIPAEGEGRTILRLFHHRVADAVWHPSRSRSVVFAQALALRNAWELAHDFKRSCPEGWPTVTTPSGERHRFGPYIEKLVNSILTALGHPRSFRSATNRLL